jgi:hypothetical protein
MGLSKDKSLRRYVFCISNLLNVTDDSCTSLESAGGGEGACMIGKLNQYLKGNNDGLFSVAQRSGHLKKCSAA